MSDILLTSLFQNHAFKSARCRDANNTYAIKNNVASTTLLEALELATLESVTIGAILMRVNGGGAVEGVGPHGRYKRSRH